MLPIQPLVVSAPLPLAISASPQQKLKSPLEALISTTLPGLLSSCRQKLNTLTAKMQVAMLPETSVALQTTVVVPTGKFDPEGGLQATDWSVQLSVALTMKLAGALVAIGQEAAAAAMMFAGHVIVGGVLSVTVTVNEQLGPPGSEQVTVVAPTGKQLPEAGLQVTVPHVPLVVGSGKDTTAQRRCSRAGVDELTCRARYGATRAGVEQDCHVVGATVRHRKIRLAVAVEVSDCHGQRSGPRANWGASRLSETSAAVAQKYRYRVGVDIGHCKIRLSVLVKVPFCDRLRKRPRANR